MNLEGVNVGGQWLDRGLRVLPLVNGVIVLCDLILVIPKRLGALADAWRYQRVRTANAPRKSVSPIDVSRHTLISVTAFSACCRESSMRDL